MQIQISSWPLAMLTGTLPWKHNFPNGFLGRYFFVPRIEKKEDYETPSVLPSVLPSFRPSFRHSVTLLFHLYKTQHCTNQRQIWRAYSLGQVQHIFTILENPKWPPWPPSWKWHNLVRHTFVSWIGDTPLHQSTPNLAIIFFGTSKNIFFWFWNTIPFQIRIQIHKLHRASVTLLFHQ